MIIGLEALSSKPSPPTVPLTMSFTNLRAVPYVFGAVLNSEQLRALAELKCSPEHIERFLGKYALSLNWQFHNEGIQECFIHCGMSDSGEDLFLWVQGVLPSFTGEPPKFDPPRLEHRYPEMKSIGYVGVKCMKWPRYLSGKSE